MDSDLDDFGNASGSVLIDRLGWKGDDLFDGDSEDSSGESLTGGDDINLERYGSFFNISSEMMASNISDVDNECCFDDESSNVDNESLNASETSDAESTYSFDAPPYSPMLCSEQDIVTTDHRSEESEEVSEDVERISLSDQPVAEQVHPAQLDDVDGEQNNATWNGFKLVGDNVDKNFHSSFHRIHMKATSIHYFHFYAVRDRIDCSSLSDAPRSDPIDVTRLLVNLTDVAQLNNDAIVLISRLVIALI